MHSQSNVHVILQVQCGMLHSCIVIQINGQQVSTRAESAVWAASGGSNFNVPIPGVGTSPQKTETSNFEDEISQEIVEAERSNAWTLMHRYNMAHDLLEKVVQVGFFNTK